MNQKIISTKDGILIIIVASTLILGGTFSYQYFATKNNQIPNQNIEKITNTQDLNTQTAGWKTYTNTEYGFEFKYPINWVVSEDNVGSTVSVWSSPEKKREAEDKATIIPIYPDFSVNYKDTASFNEFAKSIIGKNINNVKDFVSFNFSSFAETVVGGKMAYAAISVANRAVYVVYVQMDNGVYVLSAQHSDEFNQPYDPANPIIDENVKTIISTFKFADSKVTEVANWKTYTNTEYGFEFKYPKNWFAVWSEWTMGGPLYHNSNLNQHNDYIILASEDIENPYKREGEYSWFSIKLDDGIRSKNSNTVDDFWNKSVKNNEQTGEIVSKFVEKKIINGVSFILFQQYNWSVKNQKKVWEPMAYFMSDGKFFLVDGNDTISNSLFNEIISTFKFTK